MNRTLMPISDEQYFSGLQKYYHMISKANTIEEYDKVEKYGDIITAQGKNIKTNMFSGMLLSALIGHIQSLKQEKFAKFAAQAYNEWQPS